jgi:hypothetical protein
LHAAGLVSLELKLAVRMFTVEAHRVWEIGMGALLLILYRTACMFASRLHGVEILHPDVKGNITVLWCKNSVKRDVSVFYALSAVLDDIAAGGARRNQQPLPAQIDVFELATQHPGNLFHQLTESAQRHSQYLLYFLSLCLCSQNSLSGGMLVVAGTECTSPCRM